jgi:hypothetical protein
MISPTDMTRLVPKETPRVETFIALACCSLSERGFKRVKDSRGCSLKRGVTRRSCVVKTFSLRLWRVRQADTKEGEHLMWHRAVRKNCPKEHGGQEIEAYFAVCETGLNSFCLDVIMDADCIRA